ncbi:MOSC N-terminal beta barrel domain-containing protein [Diaporthe helianthi]|uniref:Molybdenum cofactor sulfurase n=1 Tax=Diaporthe helianthi TaxID=158607 RepID=A0A2P5IEE4_DIAHE|nr:MOSC N-terminal beta barrel domain-containing protein [Diaporthe helianthi]
MDAARGLDLASGYNSAVEKLRETEYPMLNGSVYLDHAGTTLYPKSLVDEFATEMTSSLLGNPHSASPSSQLSTARIEDTRLRALQFFNADPEEFDLVFVANATAGIKLVTEALRAIPGGFAYAYHQSAHTSLVGVREEARTSICLDDATVGEWVAGSGLVQFEAESIPTTLFAYAAQSNMDGRRYPLDWPQRLRNLDWPSDTSFLTILDAAALAPAAPLDLSNPDAAADFTVLSFSKIFGFPDLGALVVRRQAFSTFDYRKYFGGGTVDTVVAKKEQWHAPKTYRLHERLEDGTLPVHSIIALDIAIRNHGRLFGSMSAVASHVSYLTWRLREGLDQLRHHNGVPVCQIYSPGHGSAEGHSSGPIIAFNIRNQAGAWVSLAEVEKLASLKNFHIRTGGVCNPGGIASALDLEPWEIKRNFSAGFRCGSENDIIAGKPNGVIRASLGAMSSVADVDTFVAFIAEFYCEPTSLDEVSRDARPSGAESQHGLVVAGITVYPIKSCGGFTVPLNTSWEVRPEGLAWDREWCLLHRGSGQALSQKRYPRMALVKPFLEFEAGQLRITYTGRLSDQSQPRTLRVPLSSNPALFHKSLSPASPSNRPLLSRVCGEEISAKTYISDEINEFFSEVLDVPCVLARFPPGGQTANKSARHSKAHLQKHQKNHAGQDNSYEINFLPNLSAITPPSPPDSDAEHNDRRKILLSNESPILAINTASLRALNKEIVQSGGHPVPPTVFRANIILDSPGNTDDGLDLAYAEDNWCKIRIGLQDFKMLGSCRRCHMVCINQDTAEKSQEPFVTLSKTRRFDGKVFFGTHMCHVPQKSHTLTASTRESQYPTVRVGDRVVVD